MIQRKKQKLEEVKYLIQIQKLTELRLKLRFNHSPPRLRQKAPKQPSPQRKTKALLGIFFFFLKNGKKWIETDNLKWKLHCPGFLWSQVKWIYVWICWLLLHIFLGGEGIMCSVLYAFPQQSLPSVRLLLMPQGMVGCGRVIWSFSWPVGYDLSLMNAPPLSLLQLMTHSSVSFSPSINKMK